MKRKKLTVAQALEVVDDDLPDGAWWATLEELTGLDAGDISEELAKIEKRKAAQKRAEDAFPSALAAATQGGRRA